VAAFFDQSPLIGLANPLAPPIEVRPARPDEGGGVVARARFGSAYEGPPGCVHGGWVAAAFDEVLGFANSLSGSPGMTARLTVNYRKPTPLHADLVFRARLDRIEGRKIFTSGEVYSGELETAEAEGLFVSVGAEKFAGLLAARRTP
jgi:acyl-coenzyme A thioesterase PaaI-like protein